MPNEMNNIVIRGWYKSKCGKLYYVLGKGYNVNTQENGIFYVNKQKDMFFRSFNSFFKEDKFTKVKPPSIFPEELKLWFKEQNNSEVDVKKDFNMEVFNYLYQKSVQEKLDNQNREQRNNIRLLDMISYIKDGLK